MARFVVELSRLQSSTATISVEAPCNEAIEDGLQTMVKDIDWEIIDSSATSDRIVITHIEPDEDTDQQDEEPDIDLTPLENLPYKTNEADDPEEDDREPISLAGLKEICKGHKYGATLLAVGSGLIARGLRICIIGREDPPVPGSIFIGYGLQGAWEGSKPEWFTCWLHDGDLIEALVSTTTPDPYLVFFKQDLGGPDSVITYFDEPIEETGGTLVRFHIPASDPTAPDLILRFYGAGEE